MIVATLLFLPVGAVCAVISWVLFGVTPESFVTFGGRLSGPAGLVAWWALALPPAAIYSAVLAGLRR